MFRLRKTSQAAGQPAAKKIKPQDAAAAGANELSIKICSMDGSSLNVGVALDADIGDVKMSIANITNPAPGTAIRLHTEGVEESLADTKQVSAVFADDSKEPVLFMFRLTHGLEMVKDLDAAMALLHRSHARAAKQAKEAVSERKAVYLDEVASQAALIEGCFEDMRHDSDGEACQICRTCSPATLQSCTGRCGLRVCSTCRPAMCIADTCNSSGDGFGDCCSSCWMIKFHDNFGTCQCGGCVNKATPHATRCECNDDGDFHGYGPPECGGECEYAQRRGEGKSCREEYCKTCADDAELHFGDY